MKSKNPMKIKVCLKEYSERINNMSKNNEIIYEGKFYKYKPNEEVNPYDILIWLRNIKAINEYKQSILDGFISIIDNPDLKELLGNFIYEETIKFTADFDFKNSKIMFRKVKVIPITEIKNH